MLEHLIRLLGNPLVIIVAGTVMTVAVMWIIGNFLARFYASHRAANREIIVTGTRSPVIRAALPTARVIGEGIRVFFNKETVSGWTGVERRLEQTLASAGHPEGLNPEEFLGLGVLNGLLWALMAQIFLYLLMPEDIFGLASLTYGIMGFLFGCYLWQNWLTTQKKRRQNAIQRQLPFCLDLLTLAMEAGMDFTSALARIVSKTGSTPLGTEFSLMLHEIQLGKSRTDALRDLSTRCDVQDMRTVTASLIQAEELGSPLGGILRIQAAQQRERRSQSAEEKAMKAPIKMMFPMIFILAALGVVMIAPIVITYLKNFQ